MNREIEIQVQIQMGNITFSFKTDESGDRINEGIRAIQKIIKAYGKSFGLVTGKQKGSDRMVSPASSSPNAAGLGIKPELNHRITAGIRKVSYWNLVLTLLYHSSLALTYDDIISMSRELGKPVSYNWLNTEFQRTKYRGLVRSEDIPGSKKKKYSITEVGRKKAESFFKKLVGPKESM